eukprot:TRINITY_DN2207_c0_g1_i1.p1 TRINITY_DN2207_c0_g1~~TRINITY_DN2207_c0_g1_i1.p1  ORF type:complete len:392 (+),score=68.11 TRINITY_DN2207_c0_g1_i1:554-1729(+)
MLKMAIGTYHRHAIDYLVLEDCLRKINAAKFFDIILPFIITVALALPAICKKPVPLMMKSIDTNLVMCRIQVLSLLSNAFLCTFPDRSTKQNGYCGINFDSIFSGPVKENKVQKLICIIHYFERAAEETPTGIISFERKVLDDSVDWTSIEDKVSNVIVRKNGSIEDSPETVRVDFANKFIGGGVLSYGCVQEEIQFCLNPEMILSRLFINVLEDNEAVSITGTERFCSTSGYSKTFKYEGDYKDLTPMDKYGRINNEIIAIDAVNYGKTFTYMQYYDDAISRELDKAYIGFLSTNGKSDPIVTGNWGCGAFGGAVQLKSMIQLIAASAAKRDLVYYTFEHKGLNTLDSVCKFLDLKNVSVGTLAQLIFEYGGLAFKMVTLFEFIADRLTL